MNYQTLDESLTNPSKIDMEKFRAGTAVKLSEHLLEAIKKKDLGWLGHEQNIIIGSSISNAVNLSPIDDFENLNSIIENVFKDKPYKFISPLSGTSFSVKNTRYISDDSGSGIDINGGSMLGHWVKVNKNTPLNNVNDTFEYGFFTRDLKSYGIEGVVIKETKENKKLRDEISFLITPECEKDLFFDYIAKIDPENFNKGFEEYIRKTGRIELLFYLKDILPNLYPLSNPETIEGVRDNLLEQNGELRYASHIKEIKYGLRIIIKDYFDSKENINVNRTQNESIEGSKKSHYSLFRTKSDLDGMIISTECEPDHFCSSTHIVLISPVHVYEQLFGK